MILPLLLLAAATPLSQSRAIALAQDAMKRIDPTTPIVCLIFDVDTSNRHRFDVTVRELHDYKCGGDDSTSPVRERFRITRAPLGVSRREATTDRWRPCRVSGTAVTCPAAP